MKLDFPARPLPTPEEMRQWDALAISFGLPETLLMENAAQAIRSLIGELGLARPGQTVWLFMGSGNNGGDAAALARLLAADNVKARLFHTMPLANLKGSAAWHARLAQASGVPMLHLKDIRENALLPSLLEQIGNEGEAPALIVDGLLGTGFKGELRPPLQRLIAALNQLASFIGKPILAIDAPSGLDCETGRACPLAIEAHATITLAAAKPGLALPRAKKWTGALYCRKIGLPVGPDYPCAEFLLDATVLSVKPPLQNSYKNCYGHVYILGGSSGLEGAARLASLAALRSGCGLLTACAPQQLLPQIKGDIPEIMTLAASPGSDWPSDIFPGLREKLNQASSIAIGPGMGRDNCALAFLRAFLNIPKRPPCVFDADSLALFAREPDLLRLLTRQDVITPHPGEAASLLGRKSAQVQAERMGALEELKKKTAGIVILKGAATLVGASGQATLLCPWDIPQLAIGGAGDVLSGCVAANLARHDQSPLEAAARAVAAHALAGMICARKFPERGALASDLLNAMPEVGDFVAKLANLNLPEGTLPWPPFPLPA